MFYICLCLFLFDVFIFFFKQKTAYEMRISDWSSDVCSSDLVMKMLANADSRLCSIPLYLSSELKVRKADGALFRHVCNDQKIQPSSLVHTGDNFHRDRKSVV